MTEREQREAIQEQMDAARVESPTSELRDAVERAIAFLRVIERDGGQIRLSGSLCTLAHYAEWHAQNLNLALYVRS